MGDELMGVVIQIYISKCWRLGQTLNCFFVALHLHVLPPTRQQIIDLYEETSNWIAHNYYKHKSRAQSIQLYTFADDLISWNLKQKTYFTNKIEDQEDRKS